MSSTYLEECIYLLFGIHMASRSPQASSKLAELKQEREQRKLDGSFNPRQMGCGDNEAVALKDNPPWLKRPNLWVTVGRKGIIISEMTQGHLEGSILFMMANAIPQARDNQHLELLQRKLAELIEEREVRNG